MLFSKFHKGNINLTSSGKDKRRSKTPDRKEKTRDKEVIEIKDDKFDPDKFDKEEEQRRLELEMMKRKERIELWRAERKKLETEVVQKKPVASTSDGSIKTWSLEDDEEDDDVKIIEPDDSPSRVKESTIKEPPKIIKIEDDDDLPPPKKMSKFDIKPKVLPVVEPPVKKVAPPEPPKVEISDDEDPLDAYMKEVNEEVKKINKMAKEPKAAGNEKSGLVIVTGNVKKQSKEIKKGELIEQNQDGLEYSSEEELEDIKDTAANLAAIKQKKELPKVDHTTVEYSLFKKNFYVEVPEIAKMTSEEVEAYRIDLEGILVKGKGCPRPIRTWAQCGVSKKEMDVLKKLSFEKPTPIQCQAIPAIMVSLNIFSQLLIY